MTFIQELATADTLSVSGEDGGPLFWFDLLLKGGIWLVPLLALWVMAIYIFFERYRHINRASKTPFVFMDKIKNKKLKLNILQQREREGTIGCLLQ